MNKIKVTFYNGVSIVRNNDYKKASTNNSAGFASGGIYFTSSNDITNGNPAHIVHGNNGFIYTLGSYIIPNSVINTYNLTYVTGSDFKMDDDTYFISDISADPFNKSLTVTKSKITLGQSFVNKINSIKDFLGNLGTHSTKANAITVGGKYKVWFEISDAGVFKLQTENMETGTFTNTFIDNSKNVHDDISEAFEIATVNSGYFYIQAPSEITNITITTITKGKFDNNKNNNNAQITPSIVDEDGPRKIAKIKIPNGGWDGDDKTTFEFSATINTAGNDTIGASQDTFTFTLKRIESPFNFTSINKSVDISKQVYSYISIGNTDLLTRNFDVASLDITYNTKTKWLSFVEKENQLDSYFVINSYYLPSESETISFDYSDNSINKDKYYAYLTNVKKQNAKITLSGAGKWTLELQPGGDSNYIHTHSFCYGTQKNPLDLYKPADTTTSTFSHWHLNDTTEPIENITFGSDLFRNYSLRLYGQWNKKSNPITITGEKYSNGIVTTDMSSDTFVLTASATINETTFTWEVIEGNDYIKIKEIGNNTTSCRFSLLEWMSENTSCKIKVSANVDNGKITTEKEITVKVYPVSQNIILSPTSLSWGESDSLDPKTITVSEYKGTLSVSSNNTNVTASVSDNTVTVTPNKYEQSATITVTSGATKKYSANEKEVEVTIAAKAINYYWYVAKTDPSTMTSISPIVTDTTSPGWRLIGTSVPTYSSTNMLYNPYVATIVTNTTLDYNYIAIPKISSAIMRDGAGNPGTSVNLCTLIGTKTIENVEYNIYKTNSKAKKLGYPIY